MKSILILGLSLLLAHDTPAAPSSITRTTLISCAGNHKPLFLMLKESFRFHTGPRDGTHRFFLLEGCAMDTHTKNCTESSQPCAITLSRVKGQVYVGHELDVHYQDSEPTPIPGSLSVLNFDGIYQSSQAAAHGSSNLIRSANGSVSAQGNFYSNRDISFSVRGETVPASLIGTHP